MLKIFSYILRLMIDVRFVSVVNFPMLGVY